MRRCSSFMRSAFASVAGAFALAAVASSTALADAASRFDDGTTQGWFGSGCTLINPGVGGNPGGYLRGCNDRTFTKLGFAVFTGALHQGKYVLSFDIKNDGPTPLTTLTVSFWNMGLELFETWATQFPVPAGGDGWNPVTVEFDPSWSDADAEAAGWAPIGAQGGLSWGALMNGTIGISIQADPFKDMPPNVGLDNVVLRQK